MHMVMLDDQMVARTQDKNENLRKKKKTKTDYSLLHEKL